MKSKKLISVLCAVSMILAALPAAFAVEPINNRAGKAVTGGASIVPYSYEYYDFSNIPKGNAYHTISKGSVQLAAGDTVTIRGLWDPTFAKIWVCIERTDGSRATSASLTTGSSATLTVPVTGYYDLKVSSLNYDLKSGYIEVNW